MLLRPRLISTRWYQYLNSRREDQLQVSSQQDRILKRQNFRAKEGFFSLFNKYSFIIAANYCSFVYQIVIISASFVRKNEINIQNICTKSIQAYLLTFDCVYMVKYKIRNRMLRQFLNINNICGINNIYATIIIKVKFWFYFNWIVLIAHIKINN